MRLLIVYGSTEGHTKLIAERVAKVAAARGHSADVLQAGPQTPTLDPYWFDALIIGASVHQGRHQSAVRAFVLENVSLLDQLPSAFFSVSLSEAVADDVHKAEAALYIDEFLRDTGWRARKTASFAGAVRHGEYDYFRRLVLKVLARQLGPGVIEGDDIVYTDWDAVDAFTEAFLDEVAAD